ncbi:Histone-lysine N-methyltransferase SETMAR [Echinococcus granulosus]|nr:Histone-lysine N-methyltransferase SETMAR [Echinococcus granulosus]
MQSVVYIRVGIKRVCCGGRRNGLQMVIDGAGDGLDALPLSSPITHSCDSNLTVIPLPVDSLLSLLAFFARRDIIKGEEVCYDYSERCGSRDSGKAYLCGRQACGGFLPNHD